jgi:GGDEF domain-containing protein
VSVDRSIQSSVQARLRRDVEAERSTPDVPDLSRLTSPTPADREPIPGPSDWTDPLAGMPGPRFWARVLEHEQARVDRYKRVACVVLVEVIGFDDAPAWIDRTFQLGLFARLARTMSGQVRASDQLARIDKHRFGILLVETDEILAINFVDRLRTACRMELVDMAPWFKVRIGWASPAPGGTLEDALRIAEERLQTDRA